MQKRRKEANGKNMAMAAVKGRGRNWRTVLASRWKRLLIAFVLGALTLLSMAPFHFYLMPFITFPLLVLLLDAFFVSEQRENGQFCQSGRKTGKKLFRAGFELGWFFGLGYFLAGFYWIYHAFLVEADKFAFLIPVVLFAMPALLAVFYGLAVGVALAFWRRDVSRLIVLALCFSVLEWGRGHLFTGFPWHNIGYGLTGNQYWSQSASWAGISGLSLLAPLFYTLPLAGYEMLRGEGEAPSRRLAGGYFVMLCGLGILLTLWGAGRLPALPEGRPQSSKDEQAFEVEKVWLHLVQPNILQKDKWNRAKQADIIETYLRLTRKAAARIRAAQSKESKGGAALQQRHLVIWPESAMPFLMRRDKAFLNILGQILPTNSYLIAGNLRIGRDEKRGVRNTYNSVLLIDERGQVQSYFDKKHLVPFGEYVPLKSFFSLIGFGQMVSQHGVFSSGKVARFIKLDGVPAFSPLICYEAMFPIEAVDHEKERPAWLLNITNDGWYGLSDGPYQHFEQSRIRAIEQGLPMIRVANTGISAIIGPEGTILKKMNLGSSGVLSSVLHPPLSLTLYARFGEWVYLLLLILLGGILLLFNKYRIC